MQSPTPQGCLGSQSKLCTPCQPGTIAAQIREFQPKMVAIRDASKVEELKEAIRGVDRQPEILVGDEGAIEVARHPEIDAVVTGIVGAPPPLTPTRFVSPLFMASHKIEMRACARYRLRGPAADSGGDQSRQGHLPRQQGDTHRRRPLCAPPGAPAWRQHPAGRLRALCEAHPFTYSPNILT